MDVMILPSLKYSKLSENTNFSPTFLFTSSSATLNLSPDDRIERAYLYWAGSGPGDTNIKT